MTKKNESLLGLVPITAPGRASATTSMTPFTTPHAITRDEQRVMDEWHKQTLIIDATTSKTLLGLDKIADIHRHAAVTFDETIGHILALREAGRTKEHQAYTDEFCRHQAQVLARHIFGAVEVGVTNIGHEVHRSLYLLPEEEKEKEKRGLLHRLLGPS